jgi:hypothetical protein
LGDIARQPKHADIQAGPQGVAVVAEAQIHFGIDGRACRQGDFHLAGGEAHRALEAGRPAGGEELLRVGAVARSTDLLFASIDT